jgi:hypothetical protein
MLSKFVGISGATALLALSSALAQTPSSEGSAPISLSASTAITHLRHSPRKPAGVHPDEVIDNVTVTESNNWGGYAVTGARRKFLPVYERKYKFNMSGMKNEILSMKEPVFAVRPRVVFGLWEKYFAGKSTRWKFE